MAGLAWGWGVRDLAHTLPAYADVLEVTWAVQWFESALRLDQDPLLYPLAFYPQGWHVATFAAGTGVVLALLPLEWLGGPAFAYNVAALLTFVFAYAGMYLLARRFAGRWPAGVAATLYAFCSFRWYAVAGHINMLVASAALPWIAWAAEHAHGATRRRWIWLVAAGVAWAVAINASLYFVWIGGLLVLGWAMGRRWAGQSTWGRALAGMLVPGGVALALSTPGLLLFLRASAASSTALFELPRINFWGASLNSLFLPYLSHPWLGGLARAIYRGPASEAAAVNLGMLASLAALAGAWLVRKERAWRPVLVVALAGVILSFGLTLKWDNESLRLEALRPLNGVLWSIGHALKPGLFTATDPPAPFDAAVPMPGLALSTFVPYLEQARVFARYALLTTLGISLLAGLVLTRIRRPWLGAAVAGLLLLEVVPPPLARVPFPPETHPAFEWLRGQDLAGGAVADLAAWDDATLVLYARGETLWETLLHGQPTVAGASSVWPAHTRYLNDWLMAHPHPFDDPGFVRLLRFYDVRYLVFHMLGAGEGLMVEEAATNPEVRVVGRFDASCDDGPWPYQIAIVEVLPSLDLDFNVIYGEGWSGAEEWGIWATGTESRATWVATTRDAYRLSAAAFPMCDPEREQAVTIEANGVKVAAYRWDGCDPWSAEVEVPPGVVRIGGNEIVIRAAYAASPAEISGGENPDMRPLSLGFTRLRIEGK